ncbi:MAG TPA: hypothetical protein VD813_02325, partial [Pseudonocardia sp.]|nr:hypothetical protein [Pseudonocardia sp.]
MSRDPLSALPNPYRCTGPIPELSRPARWAVMAGTALAAGAVCAAPAAAEEDGFDLSSGGDGSGFTAGDQGLAADGDTFGHVMLQVGDWADATLTGPGFEAFDVSAVTPSPEPLFEPVLGDPPTPGGGTVPDDLFPEGEPSAPPSTDTVSTTASDGADEDPPPADAITPSDPEGSPPSFPTGTSGEDVLLPLTTVGTGEHLGTGEVAFTGPPLAPFPPVPSAPTDGGSPQDGDGTPAEPGDAEVPTEIASNPGDPSTLPPEDGDPTTGTATPVHPPTGSSEPGTGQDPPPVPQPTPADPSAPTRPAPPSETGSGGTPSVTATTTTRTRPEAVPENLTETFAQATAVTETATETTATETTATETTDTVTRPETPQPETPPGRFPSTIPGQGDLGPGAHLAAWENPGSEASEPGLSASVVEPFPAGVPDPPGTRSSGEDPAAVVTTGTEPTSATTDEPVAPSAGAEVEAMLGGRRPTPPDHQWWTALRGPDGQPLPADLFTPEVDLKPPASGLRFSATDVDPNTVERLARRPGAPADTTLLRAETPEEYAALSSARQRESADVRRQNLVDATDALLVPGAPQAADLIQDAAAALGQQRPGGEPLDPELRPGVEAYLALLRGRGTHACAGDTIAMCESLIRLGEHTGELDADTVARARERLGEAERLAAEATESAAAALPGIRNSRDSALEPRERACLLTVCGDGELADVVASWFATDTLPALSDGTPAVGSTPPGVLAEKYSTSLGRGTIQAVANNEAGPGTLANFEANLQDLSGVLAGDVTARGDDPATVQLPNGEERRQRLATLNERRAEYLRVVRENGVASPEAQTAWNATQDAADALREAMVQGQ